MIYLDNSATTPLDPRVAERMSEFRARSFGNAGSVHRMGQVARVALENGRDEIAELLGAEPKELVFTSGGTESNNYALKGYAFRIRVEHGRFPAIITDRAEHHALLHPADFLATLGARVIFLDVDREGRVLPDMLRDALKGISDGPPPLVSIMHANNETGTINPIPDLVAVARGHGAVFHTDAVQTFGKIATGVADLGVDMLSISAHKIHGPRGIGALYIRKEIELEPLMHGGAQERNRRGGTEPVDLVVGFAEAAAIAFERREEKAESMSGLKEELRNGIEPIGGIVDVTPVRESLPNILNVTFDDADRLDGEGLIVGMDLEGVAVSNGSACTSGSMQPSHVLLAMGYPPAHARAAVRFSLSRFTTAADVAAGAAALADVVSRMRGT